MRITKFRTSLMILSIAICNSLFSISVSAQNNSSARNRGLEIPASTEIPVGAIQVDAIFDGYSVNYLRDVVYAEYGDRDVVLNILLLTDEQSTPSPVIMFIQGSGWFPQNVYQSLPQLVDVARAGYVIASIEYRHSDEAKAPAQIQDVKAAIRFMRANASRYNIDPGRIGIWGTSSGGHLAALAGTSEGEQSFLTGENLIQSSDVQAVVDFYGPTDFRRMDDFPSRITHDAPNSPESRVIGGPIQEPEYREAVAAYNPITYISETNPTPPFLIVHGDVDPQVPFNQSVLLYDALKRAGKEVTFYKVIGGGHGNGILSNTMMDTVIDFFSKHLKQQ